MENNPEDTSTIEREHSIDDGSMAPEQPSLFAVKSDEPAAGHVPAADETTFGERLLAFEAEPSLLYLGALVTASVLLVTAASLEVFPWLGSVVGIVGILATVFRGGRWAAALAGLAMLLISLAFVWSEQQTLADVRAEGGASAASVTSAEPEGPVGSLGVRLEDVSDRWNEVAQPPEIRRGLTRTPERGEFDSFAHRFDDQASLAGAYDPSDGYVYGLLASVWLTHESASNMNLHLCYMLHPFSQECIDNFSERGLDGKTLAEYTDIDHDAEWEFEGNTWRVSISQNILSIRVLGPGTG